MKTRSYLLLALFASLFLQCSLKADSGSKSILSYQWVNDPVHFYRNTLLDSNAVSDTLLLETLGEKKGTIGTLLPIYNNKISHALEIRVKNKTENCRDLSIIVTTIGRCENITSTDTIQLSISKDWSESKQKIKLKEPHLLNLSIETNSIDQNDAKVWISDFEVLINGRDPLEDPGHLSRRENINLQSNDLVDWGNINDNRLPFWEQRILAIGETSHVTETMNNIAFSVLKERILKHQCKYILHEIPLEYSFYINRYINNDENFKIEDISTYFDNFLYSSSLLSFIEWLKEYNYTSNEKISLWGFGIDSIQLKSKVDLFNFIYNLNLNKGIEELDIVCEILLDTRGSFEEIISMFNKNLNNFTSVFNEEELKLLLHCLNITQKDSSSYNRFVHRDSTMNEIATFIIDNFVDRNETVSLFGHFSHLNYLSIQDLTVTSLFSFGYYMKNKYKDDYSCIALTTYQGSAMLSNSTDLSIENSTLNPAPPESLEYLLNSFNRDSIYLSMDKLNCSNVLKLRFVGNNNRPNQFSYIMPKARMDGVIFVKESTSINKSFMDKNLNPNYIIMKSYKDALDKMKELNASKMKQSLL